METEIRKDETTENALVLRSSIRPAEMHFNGPEIRKMLDAKLNEYRSLVVTEDTQAGCKNAKRELASFRVELDKFRKSQKKEAMEPIDAFENEVKDLIEMVEKVEKPLNDALDVFDEKERQKKKAFAEKKIAEASEAHGLRHEYASRMVVKKDFMNLTKTLKAIKEDMESQAEALERQQAEHDRNVELIRETVEAENARISVKLDPSEFLDDFNRTDDVLETIRRIKKRAENIYQQEKKLEEERLERERKEKEQLVHERAEKERQEREREERECRAAGEAAAKPELADAMVIPPDLMDTSADTSVNEEKASAVPLTSTPAASTIPTSVPGTAYSTISPEATMPFEKTEPVYEVTFRVTGGFGVLRELNNYLKMNKISYEILSQVKK